MTLKASKFYDNNYNTYISEAGAWCAGGMGRIRSMEQNGHQHPSQVGRFQMELLIIPSAFSVADM
jgi:hypothetical protein